MVLKKQLKNLKRIFGRNSNKPEVGKCGDEGMPITEAKPDHEISKIYIDYAKKIKKIYF